jgi:hypothetical protein
MMSNGKDDVFLVPGGAGIFLFVTMCSPVRRPESEADPSPHKAKEELHLHSLIYMFLAWCLYAEADLYISLPISKIVVSYRCSVLNKTAL